jgi:Domain of unknown function (DUF4202)
MSPSAPPNVLDLDAFFAAIDRVNAGDPNTVDWYGVDVARSLIQGQRASHWLGRLVPDASDALQIAARGHHIRRWAIERSSYPEGRAGYLRWRRDLKKLHADELAALLNPLGGSAALIDRVGELVQRIGLGTDAEAQAVEDAACLVFMETDYAALRKRLGDEKTAGAVAKTLKKMSPEAIALLPAT